MAIEDPYSDKQAIQAAQYRTAYHWSRNKRVEAERYARMTRLIADLAIEAGHVPGKGRVNVLDFGCGDGRGAFLFWSDLRNRGLDVRLVGVDIAEEAVDWAKRMTADFADDSLQFCHGTIKDGLAVLGGDGVPTIVVMREVIEHWPEAEIDRVLSLLRQSRPYCTLLVSVPSTNSPTEKKHFRHYTAERLRETLERNGFETQLVTGFGFRPAPLYRSLRRLKSVLNRIPVFWRLLNPTWRIISPRWAITVLASARPAAPPSPVTVPN